MRLSTLYRPGVYAVAIAIIATVGLALQGLSSRADLPSLENHQLATGAVEDARHFVERLWGAVEANPAPVVVALLTFALTVAYHLVKGRSVREAIEAAATRTAPAVEAVRPMPVPVYVPSGPPESPVLARAKARTARTQLVADQIGLENRARVLPEAIKKAEQEACHAQQAHADAERALAAKRERHEAAAAALAALNVERVRIQGEVTAIRAEVARLDAAV